jgi:putative transposase
MGKDIGLLTPSPTYLALGRTAAQRIIRYRQLFADAIPLDTLDQIRECTNKSWVLGNSKFKAQIESAANRRIESLGWGGDRKTKLATDQGV